MNYTYVNSTGQKRTISAPMNNPPPEVVEFTNDVGCWASMPIKMSSTHPRYFTRVYHEPKVHVRWQPGAGLRKDVRFRPGAV